MTRNLASGTASIALLLTLCTPIDPLWAQHLLYGTLTDATTGAPVADVVVVLADHRGATSDRDGRYAIILAPGKNVVRWSRVGYRSVTSTFVVMKEDSILHDVKLVQAEILIGEQSVTGERPPIMTIEGLGALSVSTKSASTFSGAFSDVYRSMQTMTGVTSNNEMSAHFNVRGGSSTQNLFLLNGTQLLEPFHLKEAPNTSVSTINADLVNRIVFSPGGFTARYGNRLSAVLDLEYREGNKERFAGIGDASLTNVGLTMEGPLGSGVTGIVSGRSSYSNYLANFLVEGEDRRASFFDIQGVVGADPLAGVHLSGTFLISRDKASGYTQGSYGSTLSSVKGDISLSESTELETIVGWMQDHQSIAWTTPLPVGSESIAADRYRTTLISTSIRFSDAVSDVYTFVAGIERKDTRFDHTQELVSSGGPEFPRNVVANVGAGALTSLFMENILHGGSRLVVNAGARLDHSALPAQTVVSPRLLAAYKFGSGTTLKAAWGVYRQTASDLELLAAARAHLSPEGMQRAIHYVLGLEQVLREDLQLRIEAYHKQLRDIVSFVRYADGAIVSSPRNDAWGYVNGVDLELSFNDARVFGWVGASFQTAKENNYFDTKGWRYSPSDQAQTVTVIFNYRVNEHWSGSLLAFYGSGFAYGIDTPGFGENRKHYPNYKRADVRVQYKFSAGPPTAMLYVEVQNVFGHKNARSFTGPASSQWTLEYNLLLPRVWNAGVRVWF